MERRAPLGDQELTPEPADETPLLYDETMRAGIDEEGEHIIDDENDADENDAPPAPCSAPEGFYILDNPPSAEQLGFSKEASPADDLVGKSILFNWSVVGWCVGVIKERNMDARSYRKIDDERVKVNFLIYYAIDDNVVPTVLRLEEHGGQEESSWVMLEVEVGEQEQ